MLDNSAREPLFELFVQLLLFLLPLLPAAHSPTTPGIAPTQWKSIATPDEPHQRDDGWYDLGLLERVSNLLGGPGLKSKTLPDIIISSVDTRIAPCLLPPGTLTRPTQTIFERERWLCVLKCYTRISGNSQTWCCALPGIRDEN